MEEVNYSIVEMMQIYILKKSKKTKQKTKW